MDEIWPNIFSIDIFEKFTAILQFCYFLTCSYSHFLEVLGKRKKVILLMGILMVAMTVSYRGIASFVSQTFNIEKDEDKLQV